jgi:hypothetical protein
MKKWKQLLLLLIVLMPSFFFLSKAFSSNRVELNNRVLDISGPGGLELPLSEISEVSWVEEMPELAGTPGFSLGLVKKGNFIRAEDGKEVRVMRNGESGFIHLHTDRGEVYFNLKSEEDTRALYSDLLSAAP